MHGIKCPECLTDLYCRCNTCVQRDIGNGFTGKRNLWQSDPSGTMLQCSVCGFVGIDDFDGPDAKKLVKAYRKEKGLK